MIEPIGENFWMVGDNRPEVDCVARFHALDRADHMDAIREVWHEDTYQMESIDFQGRTAIDVGAHIGAVTIRAALLGANVIAIEPFEEAFELLWRNVHENGLERQVTLVNAPLSDVPVNVSRIGGTGMGGTVRATTGNFFSTEALWNKLGPDVAMLKMDIEGWEHFLFNPPSGWLRQILARCERVTMETHPGNHLGKIIETLLHTHSIQAGGRPNVGGYIHAYRY